MFVFNQESVQILASGAWYNDNGVNIFKKERKESSKNN